MNRLRLVLVLCLLASARTAAASSAAAGEHASPAPAPDHGAAHAAEASAADEAASDEHDPSVPKLTQAEIEEKESLLRIGQKKYEAKDYESAEIAFRQLITEQTDKELRRQAALGLARTYRRKGELTKAAAVYEKLIKEYPDDGLLPTIYLELGRTQRALGAYRQAISRFYSVINSTLKVNETGSDSYRQLARTAQFEIAETYFQSGDYEQATRFFGRLKLLDLAPEDRAKAHFKSAYSLILGGDHEKAIVSLRAFLEQYPRDEANPEARYLLSTSLHALGRSNDALATALDLLRTEKDRSGQDAKRWAYWQRKTGNTIANAFYERGDINSALVIYESLARISEEPVWKIPVTYQIGLCLERLQIYDRAAESYQSIIDIVKSPSTDISKRSEIADIAEMATWRLNQLAWYQDTQKKVALLLPRSGNGAPSVNAAKPNDARGSAAKSP